MRKLTEVQKRDIAAIAAMKDEDIDLSDMPEVLDWSKADRQVLSAAVESGDHTPGRQRVGMAERIR